MGTQGDTRRMGTPASAAGHRDSPEAPLAILLYRPLGQHRTWPEGFAGQGMTLGHRGFQNIAQAPGPQGLSTQRRTGHHTPLRGFGLVPLASRRDQAAGTHGTLASTTPAQGAEGSRGPLPRTERPLRVDGQRPRRPFWEEEGHGQEAPSMGLSLFGLGFQERPGLGPGSQAQAGPTQCCRGQKPRPFPGNELCAYPEPACAPEAGRPAQALPAAASPTLRSGQSGLALPSVGPPSNTLHSGEAGCGRGLLGSLALPARGEVT